MISDRCIICGKTSMELGNSNPLTIEHIIPQALGNTSLGLLALNASQINKHTLATSVDLL